MLKERGRRRARAQQKVGTRERPGAGAGARPRASAGARPKADTVRVRGARGGRGCKGMWGRGLRPTRRGCGEREEGEVARACRRAVMN